MTEYPEELYWLGFNLFNGIGPMRFSRLLSQFGTAGAAWTAAASVLSKAGMPISLTSAFESFRRNVNLAAEYDRLVRGGVRMILRSSPDYPPLLFQLPDAPFVLYVKGDDPKHLCGDRPAVAVVGTRRVTRYGVTVTQQLVTDLVAAGVTIVSGLAYGVDAVAHQTAISLGGKTVAVLGCGIDIIAPPSNARLYQEIGRGGCGSLVSEIPLGLRPTKGLFPARNRIISGLSLGVLVTEGAEDSGALITASFAAEQGREVFAVPGPITSVYSRGPAKLLKNGAKLVESVDDILDELPVGVTSRKKNLPAYEGDTPEERTLVEILGKGELHVDALVRAAGLTTAQVAATLTLLEVRGVVRNVGENTYALTG